MREIKFRGLRTDGKGLVVGSLLTWLDGTAKILIEKEDESQEIYSVIPESVGQFSGFEDKNGIEIAEGDILNCQDRIVKVVWHEQAGQWDTDLVRYIFDLCSNGITNQEWKYRAVVIGNIHDNPELL